jgi:hypothetical protein
MCPNIPVPSNFMQGDEGSKIYIVFGNSYLEIMPNLNSDTNTRRLLNMSNMILEKLPEFSMSSTFQLHRLL